MPGCPEAACSTASMLSTRMVLMQRSSMVRLLTAFMVALLAMSRGRLVEHGVVPATVRRDERIRLFGPPTPRRVGTDPTVGLQDSIDHRPCGLDRVLPGEERPIAGHGVAQEPLVRRLLSRLLIDEVELPLIA